MKAKQTKWMILLGIIMTAITFTACGSDDDSESGGNGSGVNGYYISGNLYTNADFRNDVVWEYMRISQDAAALFRNPVPTWTLFDSNGLFSQKVQTEIWSIYAIISKLSVSMTIASIPIQVLISTN